VKKLLGVLFLFLLSCATRIPVSPAASVAYLSVKVDGEEIGSATGFAVSSTEMVTSGHVCEAALDYFGEVTSPSLGRLTIVATDFDADLCVLTSRVPLVPLKIADYSQLEKGDKASIFGFPLGVGPLLTTGFVENPYYIIFDSPFLLLSVPAAPGNSGSPVLNEAGEVIGVLSMGPPFYPQLSFASTGSDLVAFLVEARK
jgi:S1-C subfamily serine protease